MSLVEKEGHAGEQVLPEGGEEGKIHSSSPGWDRSRVSTPILARRTSSRQKVIKPLLMGRYRAFSESAVFQKRLRLTERHSVPTPFLFPFFLSQPDRNLLNGDLNQLFLPVEVELKINLSLAKEFQAVQVPKSPADANTSSILINDVTPWEPLGCEP
jgi:hypothetical protein